MQTQTHMIMYPSIVIIMKNYLKFLMLTSKLYYYTYVIKKKKKETLDCTFHNINKVGEKEIEWTYGWPGGSHSSLSLLISLYMEKIMILAKLT